MEKIRYGIIGAGWRAEFYLRIMREMAETFEIVGMVIRNPEKRERIARQWGVRGFASLEEMLGEAKPSYVVTSVSWTANPEYLKVLTERETPVLSETPPAPDLAGLREVNELTAKGGKIQIAEQYHLQPHHAALLNFLAAGRIGRPSEAQVSVGHGYHGISLVRRMLGIGYEPPKVTGLRFVSPIAAGGTREGPPKKEEVRNSTQDFYFFDWGDRLGLVDFTGDQYFGWIRNTRILIRGEQGEIVTDRAYYLKDFRTPIELKFVRRMAGIGSNLEGHSLQGYLAGEEWIYRNPCGRAKLSDDEVAIATCLMKMEEYVRTGKDFYPLAEGSQDHYLYLLGQEAARDGRTIQAEWQPWAR